MILNHRLTRITVGILLLALAIAVLLPGLTGYSSLDGTVNARFAVINAPVDGEIDKAPPRIGTPVKEGETLATISNERVNRAVLASLRTDHRTALERVAALRRERDELVRLRDDLAGRLDIFRNATIASLERELQILQKRVEVSRAQEVVARVDLDRRQDLESKGIFTRKMVESAEAAGAAAGGELEISNLTVELLQERLSAVRKGIFIVGDGQNDVPYSRQRQDEVIVRIHDLNTRIAENENSGKTDRPTDCRGGKAGPQSRIGNDPVTPGRCRVDQKCGQRLKCRSEQRSDAHPRLPRSVRGYPRS